MAGKKNNRIFVFTKTKTTTMEQMNMTKLDNIQLVAYLSVMNFPQNDFRYQSDWMERCYKWIKEKREEEEKKNNNDLKVIVHTFAGF